MKGTLEVLEGAREVLLKYGWFQGGFGTERIGFCLLGALRYSVTGNVSASAQPPETGLAVRAVKNKLSGAVHEWNDAYGRSFEQVLDVLARAIASEKRAACAVKEEA